MTRSDETWITDILAAIVAIREDTAGMDYPAFQRSPIVARSVLFSVSVIGEATKNLSDMFKAGYPAIPWRAIAGTRDRIVHEYFRTNTLRVWEVVTEDLDPLETTLRAFLQATGNTE